MEGGLPEPPLVTVMPPAQDPAPQPPVDEHDSPQFGPEEEDLDVDQDDAQLFLQPAMSPLATLLTSPNTPAADKAAAFERQPSGFFDMPEIDDASQEHQTVPASPDAPNGLLENLPGRQSPMARLPTPWQAGPKQFTIAEPGRFRSSMAAAFQSQSRQHRSHSVGESALKRLSKALPSISIPSGFIPSIPTPTFFSSGSNSPPKSSQPRVPAALLTPATPYPQAVSPQAPPITPDSARARSLRRTTSDDSLLYHSLSRVSSLGDDERFVHVREQVNVRFKAIKDSFDGPSFKLPQMPSRSPSCMVS